MIGKWELAFITNDIVRTPGFPCLTNICISRDGLSAMKYKIWEPFEGMSAVKVQ